MTNDGGPAFPVANTNDIPDDYKGMSLRDYFAGQALAGVMFGQAVAAMQGKDFDAAEADAAEACYGLADAMIEARSTGDDDGE